MNVNWSIERYDEVHSTQDELKALALKGAGEGQVVTAKSQNGGRGRHGRVWVSEPGNLYFSLLLRPSCGLNAIGQLALIVGASIGAAIKELVLEPDDVSLKWPNDVFLGGKKCAGILIETELDSNNIIDWVAVGIGVNIVRAPKEIGAALSDYALSDIKIEDVQQSILNEIEDRYLQWGAEGFAAIKAEWLSMAHPVGTPITVGAGKHMARGTFHDIDSHGSLILRDDEGQVRTLSAGDVHIQE